MNFGSPRRRYLSLVALLPILAGGCGDLLKQPYPAKSFFGIEPGVPEVSVSAPVPRSGGYVNRDGGVIATSRPASGTVMLVRTVHVAPPYDGQEFVYRDGPAQYTTDYYDNFIAPPSALLSGTLAEWLERAGPVPVVATGSTVRCDLLLDGSVTKLEIDRTDRARPKAVIAARFFVTHDTGSGSPIALDTTYTVSVPASADTPAGYADGWGKAWRQILDRLSSDLRSTVLGSG